MSEPATKTGAVTRAKKLNDRAFVLAVFGLFVPFIGIVCGIAGIVLSSIARREARDAGETVDKNSFVFSIVVTCVWGFAWLLILIPAFLN